MAFHANWHACQQGTITHTPSFFTHNPTPQDHTWWVGLRESMEPLVSKCHIHGIRPQVSVTWDEYRTGVGLPPHPTQAYLGTKCVVPPNTGSAFLADIDWQFRLQPHGNSQYGCSRGYFKVLTFGWHHNDKEFYLHDLLCHMYNGPSPDPDLVAGHLCGNKLCVLPWPLYWITQSDNVLMGHNKRKRKWAL